MATLFWERMGLQSAAPLLSPAESEAAARGYASGLGAAFEVQLRQWEPATWNRIQASAQECNAWCLVHCHGRSLLDCTPEDVVAYMESYWAHAHVGRASPDGRPAPSTALQHLAHLSTAFKALGRHGAYNPGLRSGNPCDSAVVSGYRSGYTATACQAGYEELSAVPLTPSKFESLVHYIRLQAASTPCPVKRAIYLRDLVCFLLMWHTTLRGANCGALQVRDFRSVFPPPPLPAAGVYGAAQCIIISKLGTKTYRHCRAPAQSVQPLPDPALCPVVALREYYDACSLPNAAPGLAITTYLFRPLTRDGKSFKPAALQSNALQDRLHSYLAAAKLYNGESCHSLRRGALQAAATAGVSNAELHALGQIRTPAILQRYLDNGRHQGQHRTRYVS